MQIPEAAAALARSVDAAGGRAYLVGGWVRDQLLGLTSKDIDVEVHGLPEDQLEELLEGLGRVNAVGRSFGVFKVRVRGVEFDVSLPRRDSKVGPGHTGIAVEGDPFMGVTEACRRRDLTLNAILLDPLTGELVDPFGGAQDAAARLLREVDPVTFAEDPLRALRAVQFAARFGATLTPSLKALCRAAALGELPAERIRGELDKLLLKAPTPSVGVRLLGELGLAEQVLPSLAPHLGPALEAAVDRAAALRAELSEEGAQSALMYGALLHGLEGPGLDDALDRLRVHSQGGYRARAALVEALALHRSPPDWSDASLRALADEQSLRFALTLLRALRPEEPWGERLRRAELLGVADGPLPHLLKGGDLRALGVAPGPAMGEIMRALRKAQHAGRVLDHAEALDWAQRHLASDDAPR